MVRPDSHRSGSLRRRAGSLLELDATADVAGDRCENDPKGRSRGQGQKEPGAQGQV